ncbi:MAG: nitronate monooxygenase family protein [bacterium]
MKKLKIGNLTATLPIVQGGMGVGVSLSGLASAVARCGAIGVIAAAGIGVLRGLTTQQSRGLRTEIRLAKAATDGIVGVNIMVAMSDYAALAEAAVEEGADVVFSGAGLPLDLPKYLKPGSRTRLAPIVSSARALRLVANRWLSRYRYAPDAVVVEGPMAGGHLGFKPEQIADPAYSLEKLVPAVVAEAGRIALQCGKPIPVIAAGGVYTGRDIDRFFKLGASGVQMATRFVATHECDASAEFKQAFLDSGRDDIVIIKSPVGMPGRAIRNGFIDQVSGGERKPFACPHHCIKTCDAQTSPYCIALALTNAQRGNLKNGFAFAGANAWRVNELVSVRELLAELEAEYDAATQPASAEPAIA